MEERLIRLEERLAFAERDLETLSTVVRELADALDTARREIHLVRDDLARRTGEVEAAGDEGAGGSAAARSSAPATDGGDGADEDVRRHLPPHWGRRPGD